MLRKSLIILVVLIALLALAACGGESAPAAEEPAAEDAGAPAQEAPDTADESSQEAAEAPAEETGSFDAMAIAAATFSPELCEPVDPAALADIPGSVSGFTKTEILQTTGHPKRLRRLRPLLKMEATRWQTTI